MANQQKKDPIWGVALAGFFGASSPSIASLIALMQEKPVEWPGISFYIGTLLMGLLGAGLVLVAKERILWKAFTQGMASPAFFSSAGTVAISVACLTAPIKFINSAYAQNSDTTVVQQDSIDITIESQKGRKIRIISGNKIYQAQKRSTYRFPAKQQLIIEEGNIQRTYMPPSRDSAEIRITVKEQKTARNFVEGFLPMMQKSAQEKITLKKIEVQEVNTKNSDE